MRISDWSSGVCSSDLLADQLAQADICLGIFGGGGKASRVLPFKMYLAMAAGKAIITQEAYGTPGTPAIPALVVPPTADALKAAILDLASNRDERARLEQVAVTYYREYLGEKIGRASGRERVCQYG